MIEISPKKWSACWWLKKITLIDDIGMFRFKRDRNVPSPQSTRMDLSMRMEGKLRVVVIPCPEVPKNRISI
jgi:hypothetical protein